jgi:hypothetical protein
MNRSMRAFGVHRKLTSRPGQLVADRFDEDA